MPSSWPSTLLLLCLGSLPGSAGSQTSPATLQPIRAGDCLLDRLSLVTVSSYPESSLPPNLRAVCGASFKAVLTELAAREWRLDSTRTRELVLRLGSECGLSYWRASTRMVPLADTAVSVYQGERELSGSDAVRADGHGPWIWWNATTRCLEAVAAVAPEAIRIEWTNEPLPKTADRVRSGDGEGGSNPAALDLAHRIELWYVTRTALLLPAGAALSVPCSGLAAEELRIAVALEGHGWKAAGDRVESRAVMSDGAVVAIDAVVDGKSKRLWSRTLTVAESGKGFFQARVKLGALRGKAFELRLVTEPGAAGDPSFDAVYWGDLTFDGGASTPPSMPHVILVDIDTLRADSLGLYGSSRPTSPQIEKWASGRATVYTDMVATASWTLPSTTSILTGTFVQQHGMEEESSAAVGAMPMLQRMLKAAGFETWGLAGGGYVTTRFGFDQGFDRFESYMKAGFNWKSALDFLRSRRSERPLFMFLHTYCVHQPYGLDSRFEPADDPYCGPWLNTEAGSKPVSQNGDRSPPGPRDIQYLRNLYDAGVARMDEALGSFLTELELLMRGEDFMVIFTSDHGEGFCEHHRFGHNFQLYGELVNIPLVIRWPRAMAGEVATGPNTLPVSSVDLVPTVLDCLGLAVPDTLPGNSLRTLAAADRPRLAMEVPDLQSITFGGFRLIQHANSSSPPYELYDLTLDPRETKNLAQAEPKRVAAMAALLAHQCEQFPRVTGGRRADEAQLDAEAALAALGYAK